VLQQLAYMYDCMFITINSLKTFTVVPVTVLREFNHFKIKLSNQRI